MSSGGQRRRAADAVEEVPVVVEVLGDPAQMLERRARREHARAPPARARDRRAGRRGYAATGRRTRAATRPRRGPRYAAAVPPPPGTRSGCAARTSASVQIAASSSSSSASVQRLLTPGDGLGRGGRGSSSSPRTRSRSSAAAFSVKVMAATLRIGTGRPGPSAVTSSTMRSTSTVVLPVPAPASTNNVSSRRVRTASRAAASAGAALTIACAQPAPVECEVVGELGRVALAQPLPVRIGGAQPVGVAVRALDPHAANPARAGRATNTPRSMPSMMIRSARSSASSTATSTEVAARASSASRSTNQYDATIGSPPRLAEHRAAPRARRSGVGAAFRRATDLVRHLRVGPWRPALVVDDREPAAGQPVDPVDRPDDVARVRPSEHSITIAGCSAPGRPNVELGRDRLGAVRGAVLAVVVEEQVELGVELPARPFPQQAAAGDAPRFDVGEAIAQDLVQACALLGRPRPAERRARRSSSREEPVERLVHDVAPVDRRELHDLLGPLDGLHVQQVAARSTRAGTWPTSRAASRRPPCPRRPG